MDCRILWSSISLKKIIWYLSLSYGVSHQGKVAPETIGFGWPWPVMGIWSNWISGFYDHQYLWKKLIYTFVWPLLFCLSFLFISWHLLSNFAGVHFTQVLICLFLFTADYCRGLMFSGYNIIIICFYVPVMFLSVYNIRL